MAVLVKHVFHGSAHDEILCQELLFFQEGLDRQKISKLHVSFENFVGQLKTYVNETNFEAGRFECDLGYFSSQLAIIGNEAEESTFDDKLRQQFLFVFEYFDVMQDSVNFMNSYSVIKSPGSHLVYKVIELYVRTFALQNSYGELDANVKNYSGKVMETFRNLRNYELQLEKLKDVPFLIQVMFYDQVDRTKKIIENLANKFLTLRK